MICEICGDPIFPEDEMEPGRHGGYVHRQCAEAAEDISYNETDDWQ